MGTRFFPRPPARTSRRRKVHGPVYEKYVLKALGIERLER